MHLDNPKDKMERSNEYLLELALQGDTACFGELLARWQQRIYAFICRYVGNPEDARDLTQETFIKAYRNLDRLSDAGRFSSWLYKIALNECRMRFRKQRNLRPVSLEDYQTEQGPKALQSEAATPEAVAASNEQIGFLRDAFDKLPEEQRTVILMKEYQGLRFQEISEVLDVPLSTVKSRMYLGLKTLRRLMERKR